MSLIELEDLPFCPGCSHESIFRGLAGGLERAQLGPDDVMVVSDIGCHGIADQRINLSTFHGLHGRSITYATGIKLARPKQRVVVLIGDGGCGIGGGHLINAARRNVGVCVVVFNNFNFGMTGGQHSVTTPSGAHTATTPDGNLERPLDLVRLAEAAGAGFVARVTAADPDLPGIIAQAISHDGFALVDVWGICTAYYMKRNDERMAQLSERAHATPGYGITRSGDGAREFSSALVRGSEPQPRLQDYSVPVEFASALDRRMGIVLAGSAGMKVGTAATIIARAAVLSGLYATQKSIIPVTVMKGFSVAEVILSPEPIEDLQVRAPDVLVVSSDDGARKVAPMSATAGRILVEASLAAGIPGGISLELPGVRTAELTLGMAAAAVAEAIPEGAVIAAVERWGPARAREKMIAAVRRGYQSAV